MHFTSSLLLRTLQATILFLVLSFQGLAQVPPFAWANSAGGTYVDNSNRIAVDGSGNSYVTGSFYGISAFGSTTLTSNGNADVFIAKYDAAGNLLWAQKAGGPSNDTSYGIAIDGSGNCFVIGKFDGTATFGSISHTGSSTDIFIAKYDASGNVLWAKKAGGNNSDGGYGIDIDSSGNCYVTGNFVGLATFSSITLTGSGFFNAFIAKYDASGNVLWVKKVDGNGNTGLDIAVDGSGNSYITGHFNVTASFGSTTLSSSGLYDVFLAKYDASGNALWAQKAGGTNDDFGLDIAVDGSGNSYMTGHFNGVAAFGNNTLISNSNNDDVFIAKYDTYGNVLWAQKAGGNGSAGRGISVDGSGNSYVTGNFLGTATFGSINLTSSGSSDLFIGKYNASGNLLWAQRAGGAGGDFGFGIAVDGSGNSYITGSFEGAVPFGSTTLSSNGIFSDMFLCKINSTVTGLPSELSAALPTYPNPFTTSFQFSLPGSGPATLVLIDVLGREVHRQAVAPPAAASTVTITPAAHLPSGVFGLQIRQGDEVKQRKVVKQ